MADYDQMTLFDVQRTGPHGYPMCRVCKTREGIGPRTDLCHVCWSPERDPAGAASWERILGEVTRAAAGVTAEGFASRICRDRRPVIRSSRMPATARTAAAGAAIPMALGRSPRSRARSASAP